jgi:hypothetical protein
VSLRFYKDPVLRVVTAYLSGWKLFPEVQNQMFPFVADIAQEFAGFRIIPDCLSGKGSRRAWGKFHLQGPAKGDVKIAIEFVGGYKTMQG